jgi:hypothetical protein
MDLAALAGADEGRPDVPASPVHHVLLAGGGSSDGGPGADVEPAGCIGIWERFWSVNVTTSQVKSSQVSRPLPPPLLATGVRRQCRGGLGI